MANAKKTGDVAELVSMLLSVKARSPEFYRHIVGVIRTFLK